MHIAGSWQKKRSCPWAWRQRRWPPRCIPAADHSLCGPGVAGGGALAAARPGAGARAGRGPAV
eukprot:3335907-Prymnesium_polylepis.2